MTGLWGWRSIFRLEKWAWAFHKEELSEYGPWPAAAGPLELQTGNSLEMQSQAPAQISQTGNIRVRPLHLCFCFALGAVLAVPWGTWDLSSLIRDQTRTLTGKVLGCNHWTTREFRTSVFVFFLRFIYWLRQVFVVAGRLRCSVSCGVLVPWQEIEPKSSALQGRFLTTAPLGKSLHLCFNKSDSDMCSSFRTTMLKS